MTNAKRWIAAACALLSVAGLAAAPRPPAVSFAPSSVIKLANGVTIVSQPTDQLQLVGAQIFLPAGLTQQPADKAGIAALAAAIVLATPVEGSQSLALVAQNLGATISYTLDPTDTRFYIESRTADFPRLLRDVRNALRHPDLSQFNTLRASAVQNANQLTKSPLEAAYAMVRRVRYDGTGFAYPDTGSALSIGNITPPDVQAYLRTAQRANGTVVALTGAADSDAIEAAKREFGDLASASSAPIPAPRPVDRTQEIVAHRNVPSPWIAVAYGAPSQYSSDFAAMLVIEALLGPGGDVHALAFASNTAAPTEYLGAYYQYEAQPGSLVVFLDGEGATVDQAVRDLQTGVARLRGQNLPPSLIDEAKQLALGNFYLSATDLNQLSWLLGRAAASPDGVQFENALPQRIANVSAADIRRVAQRYLTRETVAIVLPQTESH
jgi:zinc protease